MSDVRPDEDISRQGLEGERLAALRATGLLDTPPEASFDRLTRLATRLLGVPVALVSLVDADRQFFKSLVGLPEPWATQRQTPLSHSFCRHVAASGGPLVIPDAREHPLVRDNAAIAGLGVVAYLGIPLTTGEGHVLGSFCAIDTRPHPWTEAEVDTLRDLAASVMSEVGMRSLAARYRALSARFEEQARVLDTVLSGSPDHNYLIDADGRYLYANRSGAAMLGIPAEQITGRFVTQLGLPADVAADLDGQIRTAMHTGVEVRGATSVPDRAGGGGRHYEHVFTPLPAGGGADRRSPGVVATVRDVTDQRRAERALRDSEERYRTYLRLSAEGIWRFEADPPVPTDLPEDEQVALMFRHGHLAECNDAMARMYGFGSASEVVGRPLSDFQDASDPRSGEFLRAFIRGGYRVEDAESVEVGRDGEPRYFLNSFVGLVEGGRLVRAWGTQRDVTAQRQAESATRAAEQRMRLLTDALPALVSYVDAGQRYRFTNRAYLDWFGLRPDESPGRSMRDVLGADVYRHRQPYIEAALRGEACHFEGPTRHRELGLRHCQVSYVPDVAAGDGTVNGFFVLVQDITERKAAEEARRVSEFRFQRLVEQSPLSTQIFWPDGRVRQVNRAWERLWGVTLAELPGYNILHDEQLARVGIMPQIRRAFAGEAAAIEPIPYVPDRGQYAGQARWCGAYVYPVKDDAGNVEEVVLVHDDITERVRAQEQARQQAAVTDTIARNAAEALFLMDQGGHATFANPAAEAMFGWSAREYVGKRLHDVLHYKRPDGRPFPMEECPLSRCFAGGGTVHNHEDVFVRKDGSFVPVLCSMSSIRRSDGAVVGAVLAVNDITDNKNREEELHRAKEVADRAREAAEEASRAKDQFLAVLSHELRTPLTPVLLTVSLLENDPGLPAQLRDDVRTIRRNVEMEARLIDDLLDLTRITRGKLQLDVQTADVHLLIRTARDICCGDGAAGAGVELHLAATRHHVGADPARLQQVFWNLLNNARKFTPPGGRIVIRTSDTPGGRIRIEVSDTGAGIEPGLLPRVFNAFEQGEAGPARRFGGLGLGLAICKALVEMHGGTIAASSEGRDRGATFVVDLPAAPVGPPTPPHGGGHAGGSASGRVLRILLVEDHGATAQVMQKLLSRSGHAVAAAGSVREALALADREPFDLVISDLGLPDGSGHDLMRELRTRRPAVRGIALSGYGMADDLRRSGEAGFAAHVTKPTDLDRLQATIERVMSGKPG